MLAAQQRVLAVRVNGGAVLQDVVATGEVVVVLGARWVLRTKGGEVQTVSSTCELELVWQVIALAVPEASGVPTLKDHLSFLVSAGFTGWYFIPFEAARSRPLFRSEFSFFRAKKGLSSLVQLSGINLLYSSFKFFLMQMNNFCRSWALCYARAGRGWLAFWTAEAADWLGEVTSDSH